MKRPALSAPDRVDVLLALVVTVAGQLELWVGDVDGPAVAKVATAMLTTVPLAWRGMAPLATTIVSASGVAIVAGLGLAVGDTAVCSLAPLLAVYSLGERAPLAPVLAGGAFAVAMFAVAGVIEDDFGAAPISLVAVLVAVGVGRAVRVLGFETDTLERERDTRAAEAVAEERERIARELHDVIGHSIAVMGVQAGAVRRVLRAEQEDEREMLEAVERTGRDAVTEMRRLLGLLRSDIAAPGDAIPTLTRAEALVGEMRSAGLDVELDVEGDLDHMPPGRALAGFRILQEALTNALKYAPGAHVRVMLRRTASRLEIEVVDDCAAPAVNGNGTGHGLVGMRERVALYGGTLQAGPRPEGGYAVRATVPLQEADA